MLDTASSAPLDPSVLMEIIKAQTEVAQLGHDLGAVMEFVADRVQHLTGAAGAIVELAEDEEMVYRAAVGMAAPQLGLRLNRVGSLSGMCVEQGRILHCEDSEADDRVDRDACRRVGLRSMVVAPLIHAKNVVGVLKIASPQPVAFAEQHLSVLELMSGLIAAAMFHSAQYETNELYHRATHDALTGLANRALFYDRLRQGLALARRKSKQVGILNLDMDGLKPINDTHGHRAGDAAIRELASRIGRSVRQSDTAARLGGDEFGIILPDIEDRQSADLLAKRIAEEIRSPFHFEDQPLPLDASIGTAVFPDDGEELDVLLERADQSMYAVKRTRKRR